MKYNWLIVTTILILAFAITAGCTYKPQPGQIVACDNYFEIIDHYQTPTGYYITFEGFDNNLPQRIDFDYWKDVKKGMFVQISPFGYPQGYPMYDLRRGYIAVSLIRLNENEYGMRNACKVIQ